MPVVREHELAQLVRVRHAAGLEHVESSGGAAGRRSSFASTIQVSISDEIIVSVRSMSLPPASGWSTSP